MTTRIIDLKGLTRGDTICFNIKGRGINQNLSNAYFSVKANKEDTAYTFQKALNDGITEVEKGFYQVRIAPDETHNLELGTYFYDVQLQFGEDIITPMKGRFELAYDITREQ